LWSRLPLRPALTKPATLPRPGDRRDLARGLLYVVPALMLLAVTNTFDLQLARWVLPLAISWGWGLGQVAAFAGYRMQGADVSHQASVMVRVVGGATASTLLISIVTTVFFGGGATAVAATTLLVTYMATSAILLVRAEEGWLALLLLPGALASAVVLAGPHGSVVSRTVAIVFIGGSFLAVVCRALRQATLHLDANSRARFGSRDVLAGSGHLLHGVICGLAVSLVVIQTGHPSPANNFSRMLLPVPLLAALGVMEWQLHSFRSRIANLTHSLQSVEDFPAPARRELFRSFTICVAAMSVPAVGVMIAERIHGGDISTGALTLQCALGALLFTDLIMVLLDRLELVLRAWFIGIAAAAAWLTATLALTNRDLGSSVFPSACLLVAVVLVLLLFEAREVVAAAMNH
jgi:hypothetical protein